MRRCAATILSNELGAGRIRGWQSLSKCSSKLARWSQALAAHPTAGARPSPASSAFVRPSASSSTPKIMPCRFRRWFRDNCGRVSSRSQSRRNFSIVSLDFIPQFPAHGRHRPCRNSQSQAIPAHRASTSLRESRNNFLKPPRFCPSSGARSHRQLLSEERSRGPPIQVHSHSRKGTHTNSCNQQDASDASRSDASRRRDTSNVPKPGHSPRAQRQTRRWPTICHSVS